KGNGRPVEPDIEHGMRRDFATPRDPQAAIRRKRGGAPLEPRPGCGAGAVAIDSLPPGPNMGAMLACRPQARGADRISEGVAAPTQPRDRTVKGQRVPARRPIRANLHYSRGGSIG